MISFPSVRVFAGFAAVCLGISPFARAEPASPLEVRLLRAETVALARVTSVSRDSVTFQRTEMQRGVPFAEITLSIQDAAVSAFSLRVGSEFLLLSQGDARFGPPPAVLDHIMIGQGSWCGWLPYPASMKGNEFYVEGVFSDADGKPGPDGPPRDMKLSLTRIKRLIERFPYDPHVNDKR